MVTGTRPADVEIIDSFTGPYAFLSNFHRAPVVLDGVWYASAEHAFQAHKTLDPAQRGLVMRSPTPQRARKAGRAAKLRPGWDGVRFEVMSRVVEAKFSSPELADRLLATGQALLVEGTGDDRFAWHDQVWGQCGCTVHRGVAGANHLGRILMRHRALLRGEAPRTWTRVAVTGSRPATLSGSQCAFARAELGRLSVKLTEHHHTRIAISGLALGADTWWSRAALQNGLGLWAYTPGHNQAARWSAAQRATWRQLMAASSRRLVVAETVGPRTYHARNEFMVRDADMIIVVLDTSRPTRGTLATWHKAQAAGKPVVLIDLDTRCTRLTGVHR